MTEQSPRKPYPGVYALSKVLEEVMLESCFAQYGLNGVTLRAPWIMEKDDFRYVLSFGDDQFGGPAWETLISPAERRMYAQIRNVPVLIDAAGAPLRRNFVHVSDLVEAMSVQAIMAECSRAGASVEEAERHGKEVMRRVHATTARYGKAVRPDPARVKAYLSQLRKVDEARLTLTREQLNDQLAGLERRILELERRLECLQKAAVTLDYQAR